MVGGHASARGRLVTTEPFQLGYVTNDLDRAMRHYQEVLGAGDYLVLDQDIVQLSPRGPGDVHVRLAFTFVGATMVELIQPTEGDTAFYSDVLGDPDGYAIALHHFGYVLDSAADWSAFREGLDEDQVTFELRGDPAVVFLDTRRELGHRLEYVHFSPDLYGPWTNLIPRADSPRASP